MNAMKIPLFSERHMRAALRTSLSYDATNGLAVAVAMLLITSLVHFFFGPFAAAAAADCAAALSQFAAVSAGFRVRPAVPDQS